MVFDSKGLINTDRTDLDEIKKEFVSNSKATTP